MKKFSWQSGMLKMGSGALNAQWEKNTTLHMYLHKNAMPPPCLSFQPCYKWGGLSPQDRTSALPRKLAAMLLKITAPPQSGAYHLTSFHPTPQGTHPLPLGWGKIPPWKFGLLDGANYRMSADYRKLPDRLCTIPTSIVHRSATDYVLLTILVLGGWCTYYDTLHFYVRWLEGCT